MTGTSTTWRRHKVRNTPFSPVTQSVLVPSSLDSPDNNWDPHRGGGYRSDWTEDATLLLVREHRQPHQQNGDHGRQGQDQRFWIHIQVRTRMFPLVALYKKARIISSGPAGCSGGAVATVQWQNCDTRQEHGNKNSLSFQVSAVCRERRPPVPPGVPRTNHHEGKEGTHESVVPVTQELWGWRGIFYGASRLRIHCRCCRQYSHIIHTEMLIFICLMFLISLI